MFDWCLFVFISYLIVSFVCLGLVCVICWLGVFVLFVSVLVYLFCLEFTLGCCVPYLFGLFIVYCGFCCKF